MKSIFGEAGEPIKKILVKWFDDESYRVRDGHTEATPVTKAHYDDDMRVLVVDQSVSVTRFSWACVWEMPDRRTLETQPTRAAAIRRAVALADEWADRLSKTVFDDERDASEIEEAYARQNNMSVETLRF